LSEEATARGSAVESMPESADFIERRAKAIEVPAGFLVGAASAAYQIEGAVSADGRGECIWDRFAAESGRIVDGSNAQVACDHFAKFEADIDIMASLGVNAYRFSISWSRIFPEGRGAINLKGVDFYRRVVDKLLDSGIAPFATLYHWDLPQALQEQGSGWLGRGVSDDFAEFAGAAASRLQDVAHWTTINEPWTFCWWGYGFGDEAPGIAGGPKSALTAIHHALLAHGKAVAAVRASNPRAEVGIALDINNVSPASGSEEDVSAASRFDGCQNRWFLDPLYKASYPADIVELFGQDAPDVLEGDMAAISAPIDFLGINFYRRSVIGAGEEFPPLGIRRARPQGRTTEMGWEIWPSSIRDLLVQVSRDYRPKSIYVTENGAAFDDRISAGGQILDWDRADYIVSHLEQVLEARRLHAPLKGYFAWTLLDNFEWTFGYSRRFGLVRVDFDGGLARTVKKSGQILGEIAMRAGRRN